MQFSDLVVGVPKEILSGEERVAVTPDVAGELSEAGARVIVESGAGAKAFFSDEDYRSSGAEIASNVQQVYEDADIIVKVKEPSYHKQAGKHEVELLKEESVLVSFLHPANSKNHEMVDKLAERGVTSFTLDGIPRISRAQSMDALTSMSTVAGYRAVITAANHLKKFVPMIPTATGTVGPSEFLVVGTGVAGLQAIGTAKKLGANIKSFDIRAEANEQAKSLGAEVIDFDIPSDLATSEQGYARRLPSEWYEKERQALSPHVESSDVVILAALVMGEQAPVLMTKEMVKEMKSGSVVVDIAIDQGGNCEVTRSGEEYQFENVFISGLLNLPASLPLDSTSMLAKNIHNFLSLLVSDGQIEKGKDDEIIQSTLVTDNGKIVHQGTLQAMNPSD